MIDQMSLRVRRTESEKARRTNVDGSKRYILSISNRISIRICNLNLNKTGYQLNIFRKQPPTANDANQGNWPVKREPYFIFFNSVWD